MIPPGPVRIPENTIVIAFAVALLIIKDVSVSVNVPAMVVHDLIKLVGVPTCPL